MIKTSKIKMIVLSLLFILLFIILNYAGKADTLSSNILSSIKREHSGILSDKEKEWLENQGVLVYSADRNAPPLRFVDTADNQYKGVVVDYVNSLSLELGVKIELHPLLWETALDKLSKGETDICDMFKSGERSKYYLFTKPIYNLRGVLAVKAGDNKIKSVSDLNGKILATQKGDYLNEFMKANYPKVKLFYVADIQEAVKLLEEGKVDAVAGDEPVVLYQIDKNNLKNSVKIIDNPLYENEVVFAVPKSKPELIPILNKGIDSLNKKGQLEKIQQKWFGISTPIVKAVDVDKIKKYILITTLIILLIFVMMFIWNQSLKEKVKLRTKELEDSRNDLQIVFDGMTEYMIVIDKDKNIVNVNKAFLDFIQKPKKDIISSSCSSYLKSFCKGCEKCIIEDAFTTKENYEIEMSIKNEVYNLNIYPLLDSIGNVKNVLMVINNITNEKISKNQILQANKMIAIGQLAAGIAHEIRNPLGIVRNHSFILRGLNSGDEKINKSLDYIDSAVERASKIIDNLLNFSRISGNQLEWTNIKNFILNIRELHNKYMQKRNISLQVQCDDALTCLINQESLKHILINLITNAADAINQNGSINIRAYKVDDGIMIECMDTGYGIKKEDMEKIFNPFYTTKGPDKGTGLGLYIVYNEVKKLNGEITVESEIGKGTNFKVYFPVEMGVR
ncbi:amino acid-binding domain sensor histidine kinase [Caloramator quimbayensis]|uniref:histidine kinase n=1 Tax=Caloramator quimbayensis TaxID=1147123 RepID=A0A1T4WJC6_9CLOT|nr:transporter substrate-binding domain-containing protein [Caloramator quimbayensis]SKA77430.1 amino acid-binding domain sensor histidine kinase [Caloramator quimbayensis]